MKGCLRITVNQNWAHNFLGDGEGVIFFAGYGFWPEWAVSHSFVISKIQWNKHSQWILFTIEMTSLSLIFQVEKDIENFVGLLKKYKARLAVVREMVRQYREQGAYYVMKNIQEIGMLYKIHCENINIDVKSLLRTCFPFFCVYCRSHTT